jgi:hypothetical protein
MVLFTVVALKIAMLDTSVPQRSLARSVKIPPLFTRVAVKAKAASPGVLYGQPLQRRCCLPQRGSS